MSKVACSDDSLTYLRRRLPNPFRFSVEELSLEDVKGAVVKDSIFGRCLEIERKSGEKIVLRRLKRAEMADVAQKIVDRSSIVPNIPSGIPDALGLLLSFEPRLKEVIRDGENCISRLVDFIIEKAIELKASDIHVEPLEKLKIRYRIDGVLIDAIEIPSEHHARLTSRVKVLARLPTYEKEVPLDGRIERDYGPGLDLRVSTFPTLRGDKVVIRIFDSAGELLELEKLGFSRAVLEQFESLILRPEGTVILTGPSNSGKTTTIYSALERIHDAKKNTVNIVTIEDPVERDLMKFSQTQISPARGLTFHSALRSVLRQDPNVIVVGEIRDTETANTAVRAGMTGHLVITTIHSGAAAGALTRLVEMGIEPFVLASSVTGIAAQRLVRKVCPECVELEEPSAELLSRFGMEKGVFEQSKGRGCPKCAGTGYRGRTAIAELMMVDDSLREAILSRASVRRVREIAMKSGMNELLADGIEKVRAGITNLEELSRVLVPSEV